MSLFITVQVTRSSTHLDQIHQVTITNQGISDDEGTQYAVRLDGVLSGRVWHDPDDGALVLIEKAMGVVNHAE